MAKSINDNRKKRGRPATGTAPLVGVRMTKEFQSPIKEWATAQSDAPPLAEAIRRLIELGLTVKPKARTRAQNQKDRARELVGKRINKTAKASKSEQKK